MKFLEEKFVPLAAKIGSQKHLVSIRDAFVVMMPLTIAGAVGVLLACIGQLFAESGLNMPGVQTAYESFINNTGLLTVFGALSAGTIDIMAILIAGLISYNLTNANGGDGLAGLTVGIAAFLCGIKINLAGVDANGNPAATFLNGLLGSSGLFVAMLVGLLVGEVFPRLSASKKLQITMPDGVPPAVAKSFSSLFPAIITLAIVAAIYSYVFKFTGKSFFDVITEVLATPLKGLSQNVFFLIVQFFMIDLLWMFGLHGANIVGSVTTPVLSPLGIENMNNFAAGKEPQNTVTGTMGSAFAVIGGSGATLGLIIAIFIFSKSKAARTIAQLGVAPGIFEINEPITFGLPVVMNVVYAIPFICGPIILVVITYYLMEAGLIRRTCIEAPWVTPPILYGFLATGGDVKGAIWNAIELVLLTVIWTPFVMVNDKVEARQAAGE